MGFRDLVKNLLRPEMAAAPVPEAVKFSAAGPVIAFSSAGKPRWTPRRYEALAEEGFRKNVIAYRCVMQIATACSAVPWLLYDDEGHELDQHPLLDLLRHPNPLQDGVSFLESVYAYLEIAGNAYIEAVRPSDGGNPVELYVLRPDRMKVIPGSTGLPQGYQYSVNGQITSWPADPLTGASNILHLRRFHPLDDWYGLAPMEAAALSIDQHNAAGAWNQALLNHGARPSGALVYAPKDGPSTLTDDQIRRLRDEMNQLNEGSRNAGRPLILEGGLDWREMSLSPKDMDWMAGRNAASRDIALAFGVPAQMVGVPDSQTYANMAEARMAFYEETALPLLTHVIAGFDHWLTPMFDDALELDYDPDDISALAVRRDAQWTKLQNATFLSINEKRAAAGYEPVAGGDAIAGAGAATKPGTEDGVEFTPPYPGFDTPPRPIGNPYRDTETGRFTFAPEEDDEGEDGEGKAARKFNPYHDPHNGEFTSGPGGSRDDIQHVSYTPQGGSSVADSWGNPDSLQRHFNDHGADFNATSPEDYANKAQQFYQTYQQNKLPAVQGSDGTVRVYDPKTNTFGVYNPNGTTTTFFKPDEGQAYFQQQINTDLSNGGRVINPLPSSDFVGGSGGHIPNPKLPSGFDDPLEGTEE